MQMSFKAVILLSSLFDNTILVIVNVLRVKNILFYPDVRMMWSNDEKSKLSAKREVGI